jgi:hypothetical protein
MNFLADESCAGPVIRALRESGHDVVAISEVAKGATDAGRIRPPHSPPLESLREYTVDSTPLFSSHCKTFRTKDANSLNTSTVIPLDNSYNPC